MMGSETHQLLRQADSEAMAMTISQQLNAISLWPLAIIAAALVCVSNYRKIPAAVTAYQKHAISCARIARISPVLGRALFVSTSSSSGVLFSASLFIRHCALCQAHFTAFAAF